MSDQEYINKYIQSLPQEVKTSDTSFVVGMIGVVGSGKSTLANALSEQTGLYVASNDRIRRWLNKQGISGNSPRQELLEKIAVAVSRYLLENKISYILDNDLIRHHQLARKIVAEYDADLVLVRTLASPETIMKRIKERTHAISTGSEDNHSRAGIKEYQERLGFHTEENVPDVDVLVNMEEPVEAGVERVVRFLLSRGYPVSQHVA